MGFGKIYSSLNHELLERGAYFIRSIWYRAVISMLSDELTLYIFFNFKEKYTLLKKMWPIKLYMV